MGVTVDEHHDLREQVATEYGIALYRRYREKEARAIVGYEASWWKRHRKARNIPFVEDAGGSIAYFGYMLCDMLILGKDAVQMPMKTTAASPGLATHDVRRPSGRDDRSFKANSNEQV